MPVLLRREAVKLRKETGEERWYAPIEKMDRSIPQVGFDFSTKSDEFDIFHSDHYAIMLQAVSIADAGTNVPLPLHILCLRIRCLILILRSLQYCLHQKPRLQPMASRLELPRDLDRNADWHCIGHFVSALSKVISITELEPLTLYHSWYKNYQRLLRQHEERTGEVGGSEPEYRLPPAILGAPLIVVGLLWFGWTSYASIHWIVPIIGSAFFGCGSDPPSFGSIVSR